MANRPKGYGLSREIANKMDAKYNPEDERIVCNWISAVTGEPEPQPGKENFREWLKDGLVLAKLMNTIQEGSVKPKPISSSSMAAMRSNKEKDNIGKFLTAATNYGVSATDLFQTVDLHEGTNLSQVLTTMYQLSSKALSKGFRGDCIGVKIADKNVRDHDEQKLREGRNIIGLQMGTNQVASQEGMTPYGLGRQLTPQTK